MYSIYVNVCLCQQEWQEVCGVPRRASRPAAQCTDPKTTRGEPEKPITLPTYLHKRACNESTSEYIKPIV